MYVSRYPDEYDVISALHLRWGFVFRAFFLEHVSTSSTCYIKALCGNKLYFTWRLSCFKIGVDFWSRVGMFWWSVTVSESCHLSADNVAVRISVCGIGLTLLTRFRFKTCWQFLYKFIIHLQDVRYPTGWTRTSTKRNHCFRGFESFISCYIIIIMNAFKYGKHIVIAYFSFSGLVQWVYLFEILHSKIRFIDFKCCIFSKLFS